MHGYPHVHQIIPPAIEAARKLLGPGQFAAGQVRADRELSRIEAEAARCGDMRYPHEAGTLRGLVRNLCAELAAYEPIDGSIEISWKGSPLHVHIGDELIQANGYDIAGLLSKEDRAAIFCLAEEKERDEMRELSERVAYDAFSERAA